MKTAQLLGPFLKEKEYEFNIDNAAYVQIGIELGDQIPLALDNMEADVIINNVPFRISDNCILEWDSFSQGNIVIKPLRNLDKYTIINVAYE